MVGLAAKIWDGLKRHSPKLGECLFFLDGIAATKERRGRDHSRYIYALLDLTIFHFWVELFSWRPKHNPEIKDVLF